MYTIWITFFSILVSSFYLSTQIHANSVSHTLENTNKVLTQFDKPEFIQLNASFSSISNNNINSNNIVNPEFEFNCPTGFAQIENIDTGVINCVNCNSFKAVVGEIKFPNNSQRCVNCGGDNRITGLINSTYNEELKQCICPDKYTLIEQVGSLVLSSQMCIECNTVDCIKANNFNNISCSFPYIIGENGVCECENGYIALYDFSCVPISIYNNIMNLSKGSILTLYPLNIDNKEITGPPMNSEFIKEYFIGSAIKCIRGNSKTCDLLMNMCVLMMYEKESLPCKLYFSIILKEVESQNLPQISYKNINNDDIKSNFFKRTKDSDLIKFIIAIYDWEGNFKGYRKISNELNLCQISDKELNGLFKFGSNRELRCSINWKDIINNNLITDFYEIFIADAGNESNLISVPVIMDYTKDNIRPSTIEEFEKYNNNNNNNRVYQKRFYVFDNLGSNKLGFHQHGTNLRYITGLRNIVFIFNIKDSLPMNYINSPMIFLQYSSSIIEDNSTLSKESIDGGVSILFITDKESVDKGLMITMIILCFLCFFSAWIRTYGWMRRRQNMMLTIGAIIRFIVYLCNHIGNMFALTVSLTSWYIFAIYRSGNNELNFIIKERYIYLEAMLYTATVTKGIAVFYRIIEQCNADYFVIDWERSKGQLLRENRILPVSMWRSTFVANELNELQTLRQWRPLPSMAIILLFIIGLDYLKYASSIPGTVNIENTNSGGGGGGGGVIFITSLRIAIGIFFWFSVCLVLHIIEFQIYYRFIRVHPLQAFVDLCSVSNISIMILPELQWGYYIHGESIHAHSDVSMEEFQQNLYLESQGNLPVRGLGGQSKCQTFEVFMGTYTRQYLYMCVVEIENEIQRALGKVITPPPKPGRQWFFLRFIFGFSRKSRVYHSETLAIKRRINAALQQSVRSAEGTLLMKFILHRLLDIAPNILYMNGPQSGDKSGKDLFFVDDIKSYGKAFLYGIDLDIFVLYTMLYASIDAALHNVYAALVITFALEVIICWYRMSEGVANMSAKTLIDDRFFI